MNVINLVHAKAGDQCSCCGGPAASGLSFSGPEADPKAMMQLCGPCRRLLGYMLIDDSEQVQTPRRNVV